MKLLINILLTAILAFALSFWFPWWIIAVAAFVIAIVIPLKPWQSALAGFLGIFILWVLLAVLINGRNDGLLAARISQLLLKTNSAGLLILVSGLIGGLTGAAAAWTGSLVRRLKMNE
ncbi:MAG TPA: hypothetical protein PLQ32_04980 [Flavihumibacter sp.]|nr:hypothetical protein [Flavihumibacter sp.]HPZ87431.1 hypothetical protein [Flavihumibacter sp.]HQD09733.1 hypothetical protein [Flavihumibacter sp.]